MFDFIDLFAGIGGFRLPLEKNGGKCVFSSEWNKFSVQTYHANFNDIPKGDITQICETEIPSHDLLAAGFPCQPFSIAGKQKGFEDTRGTLFFDIARITEYHRPKVLLLENVRNFVRHDNGNTFKVIKETLERMNYEVYHKVLNAKDFGVPQNRERIFIIAFNKEYEYSQFTFPKGKYNGATVMDIIEECEMIDPSLFIQREDIKFDEKNLKIHIEKDNVGRPLRVAIINKGGQGDRVYSPYNIGITLSASGGGAGSKTGAYLIKDKIRKLSPRECARMQGFPDDFAIPVSNNQAWTQFGNSVPIPVVNAVLKQILKTGILD